MEPFKENKAVILRRTVIKQPVTRIIGKTPTLHTNEGFSATNSSSVNTIQRVIAERPRNDFGSVDLTNNNFSVTRARVHAHAYAHARANSSVRSNNDKGGLARVLNAALSGGDVKVASIKPMSMSARFIAFILLPAMLVMPIIPAYANEAPLSERVAGDVASILGTNDIVVATDTPPASSGDVANTDSTASAQEPVVSDNPEATTADSIQDSSAQNSGDSSSQSAPQVAGVTSENTQATSDVPPSTSAEENTNSQPSGGSDNQNPSIDPQPTASEGEGSGGAVTTASSTDNNPLDITPPSILDINPEIIDPPSASSSDPEAVVVEETVDDIPVIDVPSVEVQEDLDAIRARLRRELRDEVKSEVKSEIEREVYRGCKNLDGVGYYCIPDAKSFGSAVVASERSIAVTVQQDEIEGDKEIFLSRNNVALQLTHNTDDDVFPVLDPSSDLLVWQSLVNGHWQIAYTHVNDVGVPKVNYLTNGENNFNPKIYRGRIVWQAWVEGNWEIFSAIKASQKLPDDALTAEHRAVNVDGNWNVMRVTANNSPDMFPSVTGDAITWQAIDEGVWQVFSYDLATGESHRVSKKGVKSESPRTALIWNEEDETGQIKLVGSDVNNVEAIDFTELARRLVDQSKDGPKSPITNTEIVVVAPTIVRVEEEAPISN